MTYKVFCNRQATTSYSHVGRCDQSRACVSPAATGSRSSRAAGHIQGPRLHCPTRPALASAQNKAGQRNCETLINGEVGGQQPDPDSQAF